jgi:hypothetical protein
VKQVSAYYKQTVMVVVVLELIYYGWFYAILDYGEFFLGIFSESEVKVGSHYDFLEVHLEYYTKQSATFMAAL